MSALFVASIPLSYTMLDTPFRIRENIDWKNKCILLPIYHLGKKQVDSKKIQKPNVFARLGKGYSKQGGKI